jgi:hypothetical protein
MPNALQDDLASQFAAQGLSFPPPDAGTIQPPDQGIPQGAQVLLPPDVAQRVARQNAVNGLSAPPAIPNAPDAPPPGATFQLPPDVAARVAKQNATADISGPTTMPPQAPEAAPAVIGYRPTLAAAANTDPLAMQLARAGGGVGGGKATNPYEHQIAAAEEAKDENLRAQLALSGVGDARRDAIKDLTSENSRYATETAQQMATNAKMLAAQQAKHDALVQSEAARDYSKEYWKSKGPARSIAMIIGNAIGAFGAGYGHIPNFAGEIMNKDIDQYINKAQQDSALKIKTSDNVYAHMLEQTKSVDQAAALTHATLIDSAKGKLAAEAGDEEDLQKREGLIKDARELDMQKAAWQDAAAVAAKRAAQGQPPLTLPQLAALAKTIAETKAIEQKTAAAGGAAGNPAATGAFHDINAARSENGGELPGTGPIDRALAPVASGTGLGAAVARGIRGEAAGSVAANLDTIAGEEMQATNPKLRPTPAGIEHWKQNHGYYSQPEAAIARASRVIARAPASGRDLREETANGGEGEEDFKAP